MSSATSEPLHHELEPNDVSDWINDLILDNAAQNRVIMHKAETKITGTVRELGGQLRVELADGSAWMITATLIPPKPSKGRGKPPTPPSIPAPKRRIVIIKKKAAGDVQSE